jgi:hypothetical protein
MKKNILLPTLLLLAVVLLSACSNDEDPTIPISTDVNVLLIQADNGLKW